mmetsp:Transcript_13643/g.43018  ORF Transcript_13643/g.43018 Transcript_13643/m.43018 type:complete len:207 (-) Transcript_13643:300-920(-)
MASPAPAPRDSRLPPPEQQGACLLPTGSRVVRPAPEARPELPRQRLHGGHVHPRGLHRRARRLQAGLHAPRHKVACGPVRRWPVPLPHERPVLLRVGGVEVHCHPPDPPHRELWHHTPPVRQGRQAVGVEAQLGGRAPPLLSPCRCKRTSHLQHHAQAQGGLPGPRKHHAASACGPLYPSARHPLGEGVQDLPSGWLKPAWEWAEA